ncbi:MAG: TIGR04283 family arsenosugar biosynthesis glycosyltransferase [Porticoccaceae bacterium]|nr:TIGR04283 family arsenosugar biosynthesis glycosyltransferase [Porticoccaceae bacterium]
MTLSLSIVIPVLNESSNIEACLQGLQPLRELGATVIVVDGGSQDDSAALARAGADQLIVSKPGRARQMNAGAALARDKWLLFLHADTCLPEKVAEAMMTWDYSKSAWGFFFVRLNNERLSFRFIEWFMNRRAYYTSIGTGDQCQFVQREVFEQVGGFADIPLMEDIDLSKRLKRITRPLIVVAKARTSARKWLDEGVLRTMLLMWRIRLAYFFGAEPEYLVEKYYVSHSDKSGSNKQPF